MYPILENCRVRGANDDFFLQQFKNGKEFALEKLHAQILWHCNGENSLEWLSMHFSQSEEDLMCFFNVLKEDRLLVFSNETKKLNFPFLGKIPYLQEIQIETTGQCNLWCKHCYGRKDFSTVVKQELSYREMCEFFDQMSNLNIGKCFLSGGETFLRRDLPQLIIYLANKCISISGIFTNGTIYRQEVIDALNQAGLTTTFLVSLDGHVPEMHDFIRGSGNFKKTIFFIKKTINAGFRVTVNTVVMKQNVKHLMTMRQILEDLGVSRWRVSVPREQGETIINHELIVPEWQEIFDAYEQLLLYTLDKPEGMKIQLSSIFKTEFLEDKAYYLYQENSSCCEYKRYSLVLRPNGDLIICPASIDFVLGNIRRDALNKVWRSALTQSLKTLPISATECNNCEIRKYCGSGCRISAWKLNNNFLAKDSNACPLYKFFVKIVKPMLSKYGVKAEFLEEPDQYKYNLSQLTERLAIDL